MGRAKQYRCRVYVLNGEGKQQFSKPTYVQAPCPDSARFWMHTNDKVKAFMDQAGPCEFVKVTAVPLADEVVMPEVAPPLLAGVAQ